MNLLQRARTRLRDAFEIERSIDHKVATLTQEIAAIIQGMNNQSQLLNNKFEALIEGMNNQSALLNRNLKALIEGMNHQSDLLNRKLEAIILGLDNRSETPQQSGVRLPRLPAPRPAPVAAPPPPVPDGAKAAVTQTPRAAPLLIAEKTYNTSHPDYDVNVVRNFPGKILNAQHSSRNVVYADLKKLATGDTVEDSAWASVLQHVLAEAKTVAHADLVLNRRQVIEQYIADLERRYGAHYIAGWVNLDDALFLYWLVRSLKPKTIVQCGVCNGLSSAFMMLALAKNGPDGQLYVIDMPPVFNSKDPAWTIPGKTYGMVVPEGKTSGWMVPEAYHKRFHVQNGDAKILLPKLVERLPTIDMFYHDSDHTYNHMMFEFREAKRKLAPGGLVVADDISWNAALWDFADEYKAPAYNFKGAVGAVFL